jgi:hypothetical protein
VTNAELDKLTVKELRALNEQIEVAIRAAIRAKRTGVNGAHAAPAEKAIDLEKERDAWLAARR